MVCCQLFGAAVLAELMLNASIFNIDTHMHIDTQTSEQTLEMAINMNIYNFLLTLLMLN